MAKASSARKKPSERWSLPATQERSRATRARLLEAAESVFAEKGYDGAKVSDIAAEAGCSVGAVYFRFKDKDALFFAIAEEFIEESRTGLENVLESRATRDQIIRNFVTRSADNFRKHRGLFRAIVERGFDHPLAMKAIFGFRDRFAAALSEAFPRCENISIDHAVLEHSDKVVGIPCCDFGWNDVGSWNAVYDLLERDENENASKSELLSADASGNYIDCGGKLVALIGVKNLIVVDTPDALLIVEESKAANFTAPDGFEQLERRAYDDTEFVFLRAKM